MGRTKNLLKNARAKDGLDDWNVVEAGGDGFSCDEKQTGCKLLTECSKIKDEMGCWSTSFGSCLKTQTVDLLECGISDHQLDGKKPHITVRDWTTFELESFNNHLLMYTAKRQTFLYSPHRASGCEYKITVRLLGADKDTPLYIWEFVDNKDEGADWTKVKKVFTDYPSGVRYVEFTHGGKDKQFWKGHYGVKMTHSGVFVGIKDKKTVQEPFGENLLKNPRAAAGLGDWEVVESGGNGFCCEEKPAGCKMLSECSNVKDEMGCWSTSHRPCMKTQVVDLLKGGIREHTLDNKKPQIKVRDWYSSRADCGCEYKIKIRLLGADKEEELITWEFADKKDAGADWTKVKQVFINYPSGVRYVEFTHGGKDTKFWAGHYGVKMTNSGVFVGKKERRTVQEPFGENLLKNPRAAAGLGDWEVVESGGNGFCCEEKPAGCKMLSECSNVKDEMGCWSTSHSPCMKTQVVDLLKGGIREHTLDNKKPQIKVRDWYSSRADCGCEYKIKIRLLGADKEEELVTWEFADKKDAGADWTKVKQVFINYPSGVRYVEFTHGGKDTKFWAGHYGVKMTNSGVFVGKKEREA